MDMEGAYDGQPGQVMEVWMKDEDRSIVAPDLRSWLDAYVASLEANLWELEEDDEQWEPKDDDALAAFVAERRGTSSRLSDRTRFQRTPAMSHTASF